MKNKITIIIPSYKEEDNKILFIISYLQKNFLGLEIIISDGSYNSITEKKLIKVKNIKYLNNINKTRASGMNLGAKKATGDIFLFLHADTFLPLDAKYILENLDLDNFSYGGFYKKFNPSSFGLFLNSLLTNLKLKYFGSLLGDNSIFISKKVFKKIGGFSDISLMEDVDISKRLKYYSHKNNKKIKIIKSYNITSSRKFLQNGFLKTIIFMQYMRFLYLIGINTTILEKKYRTFGKK